MKKIINTAIFYMIYGLTAGAFYREYTKFKGFTGLTSLSKVHPHVLVLGMLVFLVIGAYVYSNDDLIKTKSFSRFYKVYNLALVGTSLTMFVRGLTQVNASQLNMSISGIAGVFHVLMAVAFYFFFKSLKSIAK
ncbi:MAG: DUF2871 domain-containing protein [Anaerococcus vaginalis]|uniref:DUF2871 domain-containing protein n=1 Tax=Anaerococcus vaginalis TaxID=33037 RepID=UPI0029098E69|nr:DUF2871 domain-containing protein [Anaerococcus vaginalis]MDU7432951.1 DUF2871 domain-containing protein [Anaerococcus vaginalis]